jgi:hypothetical protein
MKGRVGEREEGRKEGRKKERKKEKIKKEQVNELLTRRMRNKDCLNYVRWREKIIL